MFTQETISEITAVAREIGIEPAALLAVAEVESGGKAFASVEGRLEPLIRFEGHYFDRRLTPAKRETARREGLASPLAGAVINPAHAGGALEAACPRRGDRPQGRPRIGVVGPRPSDGRALGLARLCQRRSPGRRGPRQRGRAGAADGALYRQGRTAGSPGRPRLARFRARLQRSGLPALRLSHQAGRRLQASRRFTVSQAGSGKACHGFPTETCDKTRG